MSDCDIYEMDRRGIAYRSGCALYRLCTIQLADDRLSYPEHHLSVIALLGQSGVLYSA
jgi:hypothetical protein